jgi:hypothetical protein
MCSIIFSGRTHVEVWSCQGKFYVNIRPEIGHLLIYEEVPGRTAREFYKLMMDVKLKSARDSGTCPIPQTSSFGFHWSRWNDFVMPYWFPVALSALLSTVPWMKCRFRLRTLLIAMSVVAVILGLINWVR